MRIDIRVVFFSNRSQFKNVTYASDCSEDNNDPDHNRGHVPDKKHYQQSENCKTRILSILTDVFDGTTFQILS